MKLRLLPVPPIQDFPETEPTSRYLTGSNLHSVQDRWPPRAPCATVGSKLSYSKLSWAKL